ncbi:hypothetical protein D3C85_1813130 [compost metagenome]
MAQVAVVESMEMRAEVLKLGQRGCLAGIVQDDPVEMPGQALAGQQVVADHRGQPQAQFGLVIMA